MIIETTLDDETITTAYTEGYITGSADGIPCPYKAGTREFDLWLVGYMHRSRLRTAAPVAETDIAA